MEGITTYNIGDIVEFIDLAKLSEPEDRIILSESARWYCVIVKPGCHRRVELDLARLGFRSFYPRTRKWVSHARVKKAVERPILNRYLFVEVDHPRQSFAPVAGLFDVESFIPGAFGRPAPFQSKLIEGFIARYLSGEFDEVERGAIPVGARIRIMEGDFADACATVVSQKGNKINFKILGDNQHKTINKCSVRAA